MQTALLLNALIAVAAVLFIGAYLLAQFITDRGRRAGGAASDAAPAKRLEAREERQPSSPRYRQRVRGSNHFLRKERRGKAARGYRRNFPRRAQMPRGSDLPES